MILIYLPDTQQPEWMEVVWFAVLSAALFSSVTLKPATDGSTFSPRNSADGMVECGCVPWEWKSSTTDQFHQTGNWFLLLLLFWWKQKSGLSTEMGTSSGQNPRVSFVTMQNKARPATHISNADVLVGLTSEGSLRSWIFLLSLKFIKYEVFSITRKGRINGPGVAGWGGGVELGKINFIEECVM